MERLTAGVRAAAIAVATLGPAQAGSVVQVLAAADEADGAPVMRVFLDGRLIGEVDVTAPHSLGRWQQFDFTTEAATPGHELRIEYPNDQVDEATGADRNLWIKAVSLNGRALAIADATFEPSNGVPSPGTDALTVSGALVFALDRPRP